MQFEQREKGLRARDQSMYTLRLKYTYWSEDLLHIFRWLFALRSWFFCNSSYIFQTNNLLKENNVVNEESAIVHDNLLSGWTCNTTNSRGRLSHIERTYYIIFISRLLILFPMLCYQFVSRLLIFSSRPQKRFLRCLRRRSVAGFRTTTVCVAILVKV